MGQDAKIHKFPARKEENEERVKPISNPRGIVIGARRHRQGIGEFVARWLAAAGADICGVVGTSRNSAAIACDNLQDLPGQRLGYSSLEEALQAEQPDFVAICSPYQFHEEQLQTVAAADCHCLCEKPLWWTSPAPDPQRTEQLVQAFAARKKLLSTITQWPYTLPAFARLYPDLQGEPIESFSMHLSPISQGPEMVLDFRTSLS